MGANADAINAVREAAFRETEWTDQATGVAATNGSPTTASDGVALSGRSAFAFEVEKESGTVDLDVQVWGYTNDAWKKIASGLYEGIDDGGILEATALAGMIDRVYVEVAAYTSGTVTLRVGVPKP